MAVCYRSTFTFEIPAPRRRVARVLLADSDLASRLTLKTLLATAGYAVECVGSASEAIDRLDESEYQLVLADLRLNRRIREQNFWRTRGRRNLDPLPR